MFNFLKKNQDMSLKSPKEDSFPSYELLKEIIIIDIRDEEEREYYGVLKNSIHIPFDEYFASKLLTLDKNKKYGIMDLKGVYIKDALKIAKEAGINAVELRGGFFYLTEVMNLKPIKEPK